MSPDAGPRTRRHWWVGAVVWIGLSAALVVVLPGLPWQRALALSTRVALPWIAVAIACNAVILALWAFEWRLLSPAAVSYGRMFEVIAVSAAVLNSIPFFAGEASAVALLATRAGLTRGAALSVLALDQLLVGIGKLVVIVAAATLAPLPTALRTGVLSIAAAVALLLGTLVPLAHRWTPMRDRLLSSHGRFMRLAARVVGLGVHLEVLRDPRRAARAVAATLAKRGAELAAILAVQAAFGMHASLSLGLLVLAGLSISTLLPVTPGNLGVYEGTVFAVYRYTGSDADVALGLALVQHLAFLLPMLATGYGVVTIRQVRAAVSS